MSAVTPAWVKTLLSMVQFENGTFPTIALPGAAGLLASVLIPLALAFFGYRFMKAFISLTGFSAGAVIGYLIGMKLQRGDSVTALLMLVLGLVMSLAAFFLTKAGIFALVFGLVFAAAVPLMPSDLDPMRKALISIGAAAVIALLALALVKPTVILASGIGGGVRFAQAVMVLVTPLIASSGLSEEVRLASLLGIGAVVAISGIVAQFKAAEDE